MDDTAAAGPPRPEPPLGSPAEFALVALGGALLAQATVWLGCALRDGSTIGASQVLGKQLFLTQAWWRLPTALLLGTGLHVFYVRILAPGVPGKTAVTAWSVARAFIHFPLYGMVALFGMMFGGAVMLVQALQRRRRREPEPSEQQKVSLVSRWLGVPVWFIVLPLTLVGPHGEGDMTLPVTVARRALLRWLPAVCACLFLWTRMVYEETGEYVDPSWLAFFASFWLAEFLIVALRVTPVLRARRGLAP